MKRLFLVLASIFSSVSLLTAQTDCMDFFPSNEGAIMVNKSYDAKNGLISTTTYKIQSINSYQSGQDMIVSFTMTDKSGKAIDQGNIEANCNDGTFYLKMINRSIAPDIVKSLSTNTELVGDFLDYPNTFSTELPFESDFAMSGGEFTIQTKGDKKEVTKVRVYNRKYEKNEIITTPAKAFNASKITFLFDITKNKKTTTYTGVEWYAQNAGIVRSETYKDKELVTYTVLSELK